MPHLPGYSYCYATYRYVTIFWGFIQLFIDNQTIVFSFTSNLIINCTNVVNSHQ